jgi:hypothetical protein
VRNNTFPLVAVLALVANGCLFTGGSPSESPLANSPEGVAGVVSAAERVYEGELLAVTQADLTMRTSTDVVVIPFSRIESGAFAAIDVRFSRTPSPTKLDQLRYASRFPYGIPGPAINAILSKMVRLAPDTVRQR